MDEQELLQRVADAPELDWVPTGRGGVAVLKEAFDDYATRQLTPDEEKAIRALVFEHRSGSVGGSQNAYFAGEPFTHSQQGALNLHHPLSFANNKPGASGYVMEGKNIRFIHGPNALTDVIRNTERFHKRYLARIDEYPEDISVEHCVRALLGIQGLEVIGDADIPGVNPHVSRESLARVLQRQRDMTIQQMILRFFQDNTFQQSEDVFVVQGRLAMDLEARERRREAARARAAEERRVEGVNVAYDRDPPPHLQEAVESMRLGLDSVGHRKPEDRARAEEIIEQAERTHKLR